MALPLYPDGCIIPNIPTRPYLVTLAPKCGHKRLQGAVIAVMAESADDALIYVGRICSLGMTAVSVTESPAVCIHEFVSWHGSRGECQDCGENIPPAITGV